MQAIYVSMEQIPLSLLIEQDLMLAQRVSIAMQALPSLQYVLLENSRSYQVQSKWMNAIFARKDITASMELSRLSSAHKEITVQWDLKSQLIAQLLTTIRIYKELTLSLVNLVRVDSIVMTMLLEIYSNMEINISVQLETIAHQVLRYR